MPKANRSMQHKGRLDPMVSLDALDETGEQTMELPPPLSEAGELALNLRESGARLLRLSAMNMIQQASHGPALMAEVCGQIARALEVIEMNTDG